MEDFLSMILLMVIYIGVAAAGGKKKKNKKQTRSRGFQTAFEGRAPVRGESRTQRAEYAQEGVQTAFERDCESKPIHLHDVPQSVMQHAGEGEDPCHAGGVGAHGRQPAAEEAELFSDPETESGGIARDVLRGVIMSEILTRPCDRRAMQRNRRSI